MLEFIRRTRVPLESVITYRFPIDGALEAIQNWPPRFFDKVRLGLTGRDEQIEHCQATIRDLGRAGERAPRYPSLRRARSWYDSSHERFTRPRPGQAGSAATAEASSQRSLSGLRTA